MKKLTNKITTWLMSRFDIGKIDELIRGIPIIKSIYKFFIQKTIDYEFPIHLFTESTSYCNLRCKICPRTNGNTLLGNMDFAVFKKIIDEAKIYGARNFCLHLFGEPLLAPRIIEMVKYIKESNPDNAILLTTNATLLTKEKAEDLVKYQLDKINISFVSPDPKTYLEKTGADKLTAVENNINQLAQIKEQKKSAKPLIFLRLTTEKDIENQAEEFIKKWKNKKVIIQIRQMHNYGGNVKNQYQYNEKRHPCYHLWLSPAIHWNGDLSICCNDYAREAVLGNVKTQTINQIWTGEKIKYYRKLHLQGKYNQMPLCRNCDVWHIYSDLFFNRQKKI